MSWIGIIFIGGIAGWLAGLLVAGRGFGLLGNIVVGVIGAIVGRLVFQAIGVSFSFFLEALTGAVILLIIGGLVRRND